MKRQDGYQQRTTGNDPDLAAHIGDDRPYRPADDKEEIYYEGSPLLRGQIGKMLLFAFIGLLLIAVPFLYRYFAEAWMPWWVTALFILVGIVFMFVPVVIVRSIRYRVSNYRIDFERGILSRRIDTMELWHVDDISFHQSLLDRCLNVGTITITSDDKSTPHLPLHGVPSPRRVFDALKQRIIAVKRQRGVIKMDMG